MYKPVTWIGPAAGKAAYPQINREMMAALQRQGVPVLHNTHNQGNDLTPVAVGCAYPPFVPNVRHPLTASYFTWEFPGLHSFPRTFLSVFNRVNVAIAMSAWVMDTLLANDFPAAHVPLGFNPDEFHPGVKPASWVDLFPGEDWLNHAGTVLLWVGGTDQRHGLDIALKVMDLLPPDIHLVAKCGSSYPDPEFQHPQVHYLTQDIGSMAPLYRAAKLLLHTARGVGFALPVLEALACGTRVVSTDLPPVREYGTWGVTYADKGKWETFRHHLHHDCRPVWWEPEPRDLMLQINAAWTDYGLPADFESWRQQWTWDAAAKRMIDVLELAA